MMIRRMSTNALRFAAVPLVALAMGCNDSPTDPSDTLDLTPGEHALAPAGTELALILTADTFQVGDSLTLTLENDLDEPVRYNLCLNGIEQRDGNQWELLDLEGTCPSTFQTVQPEGSADREVMIPEDLEPGEYRYRISVWLVDSEEQVDLVSEAFEIEG